MMRLFFTAILLAQIYCSEIYPNDSSVKVFRTETNEISWDDPQNLIRTDKKRQIEIALHQNGNEKSNALFDSISDWYVATESDARLLVKEMLSEMSESVDVNRRGANYFTPLLIASIFDAEKAVLKLIERRADINAADLSGCTALHKVAIYGNESSCRILLQHGANVNSRNNYGHTPLNCARKEMINIFVPKKKDDYTKVINLLLEFGGIRVEEYKAELAKLTCEYEAKKNGSNESSKCSIL